MPQVGLNKLEHLCKAWTCSLLHTTWNLFVFWMSLNVINLFWRLGIWNFWYMLKYVYFLCTKFADAVCACYPMFSFNRLNQEVKAWLLEGLVANLDLNNLSWKFRTIRYCEAPTYLNGWACIICLVWIGMACDIRAISGWSCYW